MKRIQLFAFMIIIGVPIQNVVAAQSDFESSIDHLKDTFLLLMEESRKLKDEFETIRGTTVTEADLLGYTERKKRNLANITGTIETADQKFSDTIESLNERIERVREETRVEDAHSVVAFYTALLNYYTALNDIALKVTDFKSEMEKNQFLDAHIFPKTTRSLEDIRKSDRIVIRLQELNSIPENGLYRYFLSQKDSLTERDDEGRIESLYKEYTQKNEQLQLLRNPTIFDLNKRLIDLPSASTEVKSIALAIEKKTTNPSAWAKPFSHDYFASLLKKRLTEIKSDTYRKAVAEKAEKEHKMEEERREEIRAEITRFLKIAEDNFAKLNSDFETKWPIEQKALLHEDVSLDKLDDVVHAYEWVQEHASFPIMITYPLEQINRLMAYLDENQYERIAKIEKGLSVLRLEKLGPAQELARSEKKFVEAATSASKALNQFTHDVDRLRTNARIMPQSRDDEAEKKRKKELFTAELEKLETSESHLRHMFLSDLSAYEPEQHDRIVLLHQTLNDLRTTYGIAPVLTKQEREKMALEAEKKEREKEKDEIRKQLRDALDDSYRPTWDGMESMFKYFEKHPDNQKQLDDAVVDFMRRLKLKTGHEEGVFEKVKYFDDRSFKAELEEQAATYRKELYDKFSRQRAETEKIVAERAAAKLRRNTDPKIFKRASDELSERWPEIIRSHDEDTTTKIENMPLGKLQEFALSKTQLLEEKGRMIRQVALKHDLDKTLFNDAEKRFDAAIDADMARLESLRAQEIAHKSSELRSEALKWANAHVEQLRNSLAREFKTTPYEKLKDFPFKKKLNDAILAAEKHFQDTAEKANVSIESLKDLMEHFTRIMRDITERAEANGKERLAQLSRARTEAMSIGNSFASVGIKNFIPSDREIETASLARLKAMVPTDWQRDAGFELKQRFEKMAKAQNLTFNDIQEIYDHFTLRILEKINAASAKRAERIKRLSGVKV